MRALGLALVLGCSLAAQRPPSALSPSREETHQVLTDFRDELAQKGVEEGAEARVRSLTQGANLSQTKTKALLGLQGTANKAQVASAFKAELAQKATWLTKWKAVAGVLDYGSTLGQAGGYLAEGDARGALGVLADKAGQKLSGLAGAAAGTLGAGPLGTVAGAAMGEASWNLNPLKTWFQSTVDRGRDQAAADRQLGYRPTWRDHQAAEAKKQRDAAKDPAAAPADEDEALRKQVESRLISQNLPVSEGLVNQLVGLIQSRGQDALEAALKECTAMQGTFAGTLKGRGALTLTVAGLGVSGTFAHRAEASAGGMTAVATTTGAFSGTFDPVSGNLAFRGTLSTVAVAKGVKPTPDLAPISFTGHFTGQGFTGTALVNGQSMPWEAVR
jgi:hypothetical protein